MAEPIDITVTVRNSTPPQVDIKSRAGAEGSGSVHLNGVHREMVEILERWLGTRALRHKDEFRVLGTALYEALFNGEVRSVFEDQLRKLDGSRQLSLHLVFGEGTHEIARHPWEFMYCPEPGGGFLASLTNLTVSRGMTSAGDRPSLLRAPGPLRVLVIAAHPSDVTDEPEAYAGVVGALHDEPGIEVVAEFAGAGATTARINDKLATLVQGCPGDLCPADVVHYIGYAREIEREQALALNRADGTAEWVGPDDFWIRVRGARPRLVFLSLCDPHPSPRAADPDGERRRLEEREPDVVARASILVQGRAAAGVVMRYPLLPAPAARFTAAFYRELAAARTIAEAMQEARFQMLLGTSEHGWSGIGSPVIYMQSVDGPLVTKRPAAAPGVSQSPGRGAARDAGEREAGGQPPPSPWEGFGST